MCITEQSKFFNYYKIWNTSNSTLVKMFYERKLRKLLIKNNCFLSYKTRFCDIPIFPHGLMGVFISQYASLGKNCTIFHQVTIGSTTIGNKGAPSIGDNVYIGAGAKIIGNVKIGSNVRIGANCTVVKDVPDNTTVVSAPSRYIVHEKH